MLAVRQVRHELNQKITDHPELIKETSSELA